MQKPGLPGFCTNTTYFFLATFFFATFFLAFAFFFAAMIVSLKVNLGIV